MKKLIILPIILIPVLWAINFYRQNLSLKPVVSPPVSYNTTGLPLNLPPGFSIEIFASDLGNPRDLEFDPAGNLLVSIPSRGEVLSLPSRKAITSGLNKPHGLAYVNGKLYIAEEDKVTVNGKKIIDLPSGGNHVTRSLLVKDSQLYVSIGSSCNVCNEKDPRRAAIYVANLDGANFRPFATGLRNSVFMTTHPQTGQIWATDMGRDLLSNDLPPDEINIVTEYGHYGWPVCYGKQQPDPFGKPSARCYQTNPSLIDLPAHSAPLGLAFIPNSWPPEYRGKLLVAYHGSWNRNPPTGYKIVLIDTQTKQISDFISGWLQSDNTALGRPVDLTFDSTGNLFISDDKRGVIYKVTPPAPGP